MIPNLETERLVLRPFELSDVEVVREFLKDDEIVNNSPIIKCLYTNSGGAESFVNDNIRAAKHDSVVYAITLKNDKKLIGGISLYVPTREMGFFIGKPYRRNGYCTEVVEKMICYAYTEWGIDNIEVRILPTNTASIEFCKKIGAFQKENKIVFDDTEMLVFELNVYVCFNQSA